MNILFDSSQILGEYIDFGRRDIFPYAFRLAGGHDVFIVFFLIDARYVTAIQNVIDILHHHFTDDLGIAEQK
jgi:hypothetical protein